MQLTASAVLLFVAAVSADTEHGDAEDGFHTLVGIPTATWIKAREDRIHTEAKTRIYEGEYVSGSPAIYAFFGGLIINTVNKKGIHEKSTCGSTLLSEKRLVTAAHCWDDGSLISTDMTVVLGSTYLFYGGLRMVTRKVVTHHKWRKRGERGTLTNDIAIIYLPNKVTFSDTIFPIDVPEYGEMTQEWDLHYARTYGYGVHETSIADFFNFYGPSLRTVELQLISNEKCSRQLLRFPPSPTQMCSSGAEGRGPCYGDSGGPLITYTKDRKILIGITSYMEGPICGQGPNVYTRVGEYVGFIAAHVSLPKYEFHLSPTSENITIFWMADME